MLNLFFFGDVALDKCSIEKLAKKIKIEASIIIPFGLFFLNHVRAKIIIDCIIIISTCSQSPSFNFYAITRLSHAFLFWFWGCFLV